jgi:hypothetical protein
MTAVNGMRQARPPLELGSAGTRTQNQRLKRALLYRLSYRPVEWEFLTSAEIFNPESTDQNHSGLRYQPVTGIRSLSVPDDFSTTKARFREGADIWSQFTAKQFSRIATQSNSDQFATVVIA